MRKFKRFRLHSSRLRSLLILTGALMLLAAFAPRANADLIAYYNFEGPANVTYPVNLDSHVPAFFSSDNTLILNNGAMPPVAYPPADVFVGAPLALNVAPGDPAPNLTSMGIHHSADSNLAINIPLFSSQGFFETMTVSFAINVQGNGYSAFQGFYSTDHGATFTAIGVPTTLPPAGTDTVFSFVVPAAANNKPGLELRILFTGGQSNGNDAQDEIDNIQVNGTIVPEPATVAGGLLGILGLCWFQRRRLIRSVGFRKA